MAKPTVGSTGWGTVLNDHLTGMETDIAARQVAADLDADTAALVTSGGATETALSATYAKAEPLFLFAAFAGNSTADQTLWVYTSDDGITLTDPASRNPVTTGLSVGSYIRDPSLVEWRGWFYVAHTRADPDTGFDLIRSRDLTTWEHVTTVDCSTVPGITQTWAPKLFIDGNDVYAYFTANAANPYWVKATNESLTAWTTPAALTIMGGPADVIDGFVIKDAGTYYLWFKDEAAPPTGKKIWLATGTTPEGPFTVTESGDWTGWGNAEGPTVIRLPEGGYRAYFDQLDAPATATLGVAYSEADALTGPWSAPVALPTPADMSGGQMLRHGSPLVTTTPLGAVGTAAFERGTESTYADTDWTAITTFYNGWTSYGAGSDLYYRIRNDRLELLGFIKGGTSNAEAFLIPHPIPAVPAGYTNIAFSRVVDCGALGVAQVGIHSSVPDRVRVQLQSGDNTFVDLSGVSIPLT